MISLLVAAEIAQKPAFANLSDRLDLISCSIRGEDYMYTGVYRLEIDTKQRVPVPPKLMRVLRENKSKHLFMTRGMDRCIACYDQQGWDSYQSRVYAVDMAEKDKNNLIRELIKSAQKVKLDWKHRITIHNDLMNWAGISTQRAVVVGCGEFFEIWDPNEYEEMKKDQGSIYGTKPPL
jgi:MraZ protein